MSERKIIIGFVIGILIFLFLNLGDRALWGVEGRWAEGVREMMLRNDWWIPTINGNIHVTKPLIPYWMIKITALIYGKLDEWSVRLPSAICGVLTLIGFYALARYFFDTWWALNAVGIFATTWGFVGYARVAQSEIYQLAGIVSAFAFYVWFRDKKSFWGYLGFWFSALFAALSKGLPGFAVPVLVVLIDIILKRSFYHFNLKNFGAVFLILILYFLHYLIIAYAIGSDLPFYLIVRENLTQVTDPYDHQRPFYVYFYYLPQLFLPWTLFFLLALVFFIKNFKHISLDQRFWFLSLVAIFLLFDLAQARRSYYILPVLPFGVLLITSYIKEKMEKSEFLVKILFYFHGLITSLAGLALIFIVLIPKYFLSASFSFRLLLLITGLLVIIILLWFMKKKIYLWGLIFSYLVLAISGISIATSILTTPSEKVFGKSLSEFKLHFPQAKICGYQKISANLFFYLASPVPIPVYQDLNSAIKDCELIFFREKIYKEILHREKALITRGNFYKVDKSYQSQDLNNNYVLWDVTGKYQLENYHFQSSKRSFLSILRKQLYYK